MVRISRDELVKLARMSQLHIDEQDIPYYIKQLEDRLTSAARVNEIVAQHTDKHTEQDTLLSNVFREDVVVATDPEPLLAQAPQREGDYFVVPVIIKQK